MKRFLPILAMLLLVSCGGKNNTAPSEQTPSIDYAAAKTPAFDADSAYSFVSYQVACGMRTPGSKGHDVCLNYISRTMSRFCDTVILQDFNATLWNGTRARGTNIICSLRPENPQRILLAAHWDSRLWADHDPDEKNHKSPLLGANDGASGVGLLMEMARAMQQMPPSVGVDFIFFDLEDQGLPEWANEYKDNTWCLGSQYWAKNKHLPYYHAIYGILFDMVGTQEPRFTKEEVSRSYAPGITDKLWRTAAALGHNSIFVDAPSDPILDDHLYINQIAGIPTVDIVQNSLSTSFFTHWHTLGDDLSCISRQTLQLVAEVVMKTVYGDYPAK